MVSVKAALHAFQGMLIREYGQDGCDAERQDS
jgi:hypothetical protein